MARLSIELPDDLRKKAESRAAEAGHASVERYIESLIRADAEDDEVDFGGPDHLTFSTRGELETLLQDRLNDSRPGIEATAEFWRDLKARAVARRKGGSVP